MEFNKLNYLKRNSRFAFLSNKLLQCAVVALEEKLADESFR
jgi:hypothetical protein